LNETGALDSFEECAGFVENKFQRQAGIASGKEFLLIKTFATSLLS